MSVLLVAFYFYYQRPPPPRFWILSGTTMGTTYSIKFTDRTLNQMEIRDLKEQIDALLVEINRQMSTYIPDSEISTFNHATDNQRHKVSPGFVEVTRLALELCWRTGGAFNPTLDHLINLWGFGPDGPTKQPDEQEIQDALSQVGCDKVVIHPDNTLQKMIPAARLNLNAIAKGWGVDQVAGLLEQHNITNYFVEIGGEVFARGQSEKMRPWRVGIDRPVEGALPGEAYDLIVELDGLALATSGSYRNFSVTEDGRKISHILDTRTGQPVVSRTVGVSVIATNCALADALATALYVMGSEQGIAWVNQQQAVAAVFMDFQDDGTLTTAFSGGFENHLLKQE